MSGRVVERETEEEAAGFYISEQRSFCFRKGVDSWASTTSDGHPRIDLGYRVRRCTEVADQLRFL